MNRPPNYLKMYRKKSPLTQSDIAFLMELTDYSNISRYEKGQRNASIDFLLMYHLLFNTSIESFYEQQSDQILSKLLNRIDLLIEDIRKEERSRINTFRIEFLESVINRLTNQI